MLNQENVWNGLTYAFVDLSRPPRLKQPKSVKQGYIDKGDDSENCILSYTLLFGN